MAQEIQKFSVTIPAGTLPSSPALFDLNFPPREVTEIEIVIPPGPRGEVGFQIGMGGSQLIPYTVGQYFVTDNETIHWPVSGMPDSGAWQMIAYNTGAFNHTIEVRFMLDLVADSTAGQLQPVSNTDLSGSTPSPDVTPPPPPDFTATPPPEAA